MVQELNNLVAENHNVLPSQTVNREQFEAPVENVDQSKATSEPVVTPVDPPPEESQSSMPHTIVDTYA